MYEIQAVCPKSVPQVFYLYVYAQGELRHEGLTSALAPRMPVITDGVGKSRP